MKYNMKYKMVTRMKETKEKFYERKSNNLQWFDKYLKKENFESQIFEKVGNRWKLIYSEY